MIAGALRRYEGIYREPLWLDELYSLELSVGRPYGIVCLINGWPKDGADVILPGMVPMDSLPMDHIGKLFKMNPEAPQ
jgi:hypothetical protein